MYIWTINLQEFLQNPERPNVWNVKTFDQLTLLFVQYPRQHPDHHIVDSSRLPATLVDHQHDHPVEYNVIRLKKKILCLKACENFSNRRGMRFFIFYFILFFYFNWPLPPRTSETKNDWKVSTSVFSEIKRDFTRFLSSHVLKFFQNSKLTSFFVVKMKKKIISRKKKWKSQFCKIKCAQKNKCGQQLWDTEFFFFSLKTITVGFFYFCQFLHIGAGILSFGWDVLRLQIKDMFSLDIMLDCIYSYLIYAP